MSEDPTNYTGFDSTRFARVGKAPADAIEIISGSAVASSYMPYFVDTTDSYANQLGMAVSFHHVPSEQNIYFKAFITAFTETYSSDWNEEVVYGRADPIVLFKNTWKVFLHWSFLTSFHFKCHSLYLYIYIIT